ncbi:MAG: cytochrome C oxidase subunit IV family protein [Thermomicrobiales bacterium]
MAQHTEAIEHNGHGHEHPGEFTYIKVAVFLVTITIVEVAIYYIDWMHDTGALVPTLIVLSAIKFSAVVGYFMHLKFDDKLFLWKFGSGLAIAASVVLVLAVLFGSHGLDYAQTLLP